MCAKNIDRLRKVMSSTVLCNRCGSCVGLSEGRIRFSDREREYLPVICEPIPDEMADMLWYACTGRGLNFPAMNRVLFNKEGSFHPFTGTYNALYTGYSNDPDIRSHGSSGGIISHLLIWLLEKHEIDGAVVLGMSPEKPWENRPFIATTREGILSAAQSKYTISSVNEILPSILQFNGRLAFTGLPGQVQSIRKLQQIGHPAVQNIRYIIGPFYGNCMHFSSIISLLRSYGIKDYRKIRNLQFRWGDWPGNLRIEMEDGKVILLKKFYANYLIPFYICKSSLFCTDLTNEFTDISAGDAWAPQYEERGRGFSLVIARNRSAQELLERMSREKIITLAPISFEEAIKMHSHGYDFKKRGAFIRIAQRKNLGLPAPDYGYAPRHFSPGRWIMEIFLDFLFLVLGTQPARFILQQIPPEHMGRMFEKARMRWKKMTGNIRP